MNLQILGEIVLFSGAVWYINSIYKFIEFNKLASVECNKFNRSINDITDYSKIFPTNNIDIDTIILSIVNKETLISLSTVNKYLNNIIMNNSFWRLRMETRLGLKTKNVDTNYKLITNLLDNNRSLSDNMGLMIKNYKCRYFKQVYDILGENKKHSYYRKDIENKYLGKTINDIHRDIFRPFFKTQYDFKEWNKFIKETDPRYNFKGLTDIMEIKITVNFEDNDEIITIKCNGPNKLMILLFEFSRRLRFKTISISGIENNSDILNKLLYKIIEKLTLKI
jgi:hypothetical protein